MPNHRIEVRRFVWTIKGVQDREDATRLSVQARRRLARRDQPVASLRRRRSLLPRHAWPAALEASGRTWTDRGGCRGSRGHAFVAAGNGLTDLVKRPTSTAHTLTPPELRSGEAVL